MGAPARAPEGASAEGRSILGRLPARLAENLARGVFAGRVAIWGVVVPLAGLVVAWSTILVFGDEDEALALGARWGTVFAWWLGGIIVAILGRRIVEHSLLAGRRLARREDFHRLLTEEYGRQPMRRTPEARPALTLVEVIISILTALMILSLAAPAAGMPGEEDFLLFGAPAVILGVVGLLVAAVCRRQSERESACRKRFDRWKTRREVRREASAAKDPEGAK